MSVEMIPLEAEAHLTWAGLTAALEAGHRLPKAEIARTAAAVRSVALTLRRIF